MYGMNRTDGQWIAISREECERQRRRVVFDDGYRCPECGNELNVGITTPGYSCKNKECHFRITWPEIDYPLMLINVPGFVVITAPDFMSQLKNLISQNPTHPVTEVIERVIALYEHMNETPKP